MVAVEETLAGADEQCMEEAGSSEDVRKVSVWDHLFSNRGVYRVIDIRRMGN